jgi:cyclophilin family peptidyl-prolyl cis-trans isomerase
LAVSFRKVLAPQTRRRLDRFSCEALEGRLLLTAAVTNPISLQTAPENTPTTIDLSTHITDPAYPGTLVQLVTNLGDIEIELFNAAAPQTVANFLQYVNNGLYDNTIIHRAVNDTTTPLQLIQGGGFMPDGTAIPTFAAIPNEFSIPNTRGTIAMAKPADSPDGATSQWFINDSNNPGLDDPTNDGGFTVFGTVISGLPVVDAITALPTVDGTSLNANIGTQLPVQSAGGGLASTNLVTVQSATVVPDISVSAVSDNLQLVNPTVSGTQLTLNPAPGRSGFCHVTVTAQDLAGNVVTERILVEVTPSAPRSLNVNLGGGNPKSVTYKDVNGLSGSITLSGPGTAVVAFSGDSMRLTGGGGHVAGDNLTVMSVTGAGTTGATSLVVRGRGGARKTPLVIGPVSTSGAFNSIKAKRASIEGGVAAQSGLGKIDADYVDSGTINTGAAAGQGARFSIKGLAWTDVGVISAAAIGAVRINSWSNADSVSESVQAPFVRSVHSRGNFSPGLQLSGSGAPAGRSVGNLNISGYIGGAWNFPGALSNLSVGGVEADFNGDFSAPLKSLRVKGNFFGSLTAAAIGVIDIRGLMQKATITLTNGVAAGATDLQSLVARKGIIDSVIQSAGNIGSISAESIAQSTLFAGVGANVAAGTLPAAIADFSGAASIAVVSLHPTSKESGYSNSVIAAENIGTLSLATVSVNNAGTAFGVSAVTLGSLTALDTINHVRLSFRKITTQAQANAVLAADSANTDFQVIVAS